MKGSIQEAVMEIHAAMDSEKIYLAMSRQLDQRFGIQEFSIFLFNNDSQQYNLDFSTTIGSSYWDEIFFDREDVPFDYFSGQEPLNIPSQLSWFGNEYDIYWVNLLMRDNEVAMAFVAHEYLENFSDYATILQIFLEQSCLSLIKTKIYEEMCSFKEESAAKLDAINEMGELLGNLDLDRIMAKLMEVSLKIMLAEVGSIMLFNEENELSTTIEWGLKDDFVKSIIYTDGTRLIDKVTASKTVYHIEDLPHDQELKIAGNHNQYSVNSIISFPLFTKNKTYGVINVINQEGGTSFGNLEIETLKTVTQLASIAIENAVYHRQAVEQEKLLEQLRIAGDIQRGLLPQKNPAIEGLDISGVSMPAVNVGGDFFDYINIAGNNLCVVIGDVAGKGIPAALLMAMTRSMVRSSLQQSENSLDDLPRKVQSVNDSLARENLNGKFVTALIYILDLKAMKIHFLSAGHTPLYIFRARDSNFQTFNEGGLPFGILEHEQYQHTVADINPGDILVAYTDGVTEAQGKDGEQFGYQRLEDIIKKNAGENAQAIRNAIIKEVETFSVGMPQFDDLTLVVAKITNHSSIAP